MYLNELHRMNERNVYDTVDPQLMNEHRSSTNGTLASPSSSPIVPFSARLTPNNTEDVTHYEQLKTRIDGTAYTSLHSRCHMCIRYRKCIIFCSILSILLASNIITVVFLMDCALSSSKTVPPRDCMDLLQQKVGTTSGAYVVTALQRHIYVYCDMDTDGGGWTVFQNRFDGSEDFNRTFLEYTYGFGNLTSEFWLGLQNVFDLTSENPNVLRIDLMDENGLVAYETFQLFSLSRRPEYKLFISAPDGTAGKALMEHLSQPFSNKDHNQEYSICSQHFWNGWWFKPAPYENCFQVNLNGLYLTPGSKSWFGTVYSSFRSDISLKKTKMMFRRQQI